MKKDEIVEGSAKYEAIMNLLLILSIAPVLGKTLELNGCRND